MVPDPPSSDIEKGEVPRAVKAAGEGAVSVFLCSDNVGLATILLCTFQYGEK